MRPLSTSVPEMPSLVTSRRERPYGVHPLGGTQHRTVECKGVLMRRVGCYGEIAAWWNAPAQPRGCMKAWPECCELRPIQRAVTAELSRKGPGASELRSAASNLPMMRFPPTAAQRLSMGSFAPSSCSMCSCGVSECIILSGGNPRLTVCVSQRTEQQVTSSWHPGAGLQPHRDVSCRVGGNVRAVTAWAGQTVY
jgi:hypothetical protein